MFAMNSRAAQPQNLDSDRLEPEPPPPPTLSAELKHAAKHFHVPLSARQKYLLFSDPTYQLKGWVDGIVRWRYNDSGRNATVVGAATASEAIATIQAAQAKWSAVCNVQFVYEGPTAAVPTPTNMSGGTLDTISSIGWAVLPGGASGVAGVAYSGASQPLPIIEGDMALSNAFSHNLAVTALHETGHMLGLDHSNVSFVVMSGPPLTSYVSLNALQADDIAGCVFLYGLPVPTIRTISGVVSASSSGFVSGVLFHARPASTVNCTASNGSGQYSCTVPSGWSGVLHSQSVSGQRIPAQSFTSVAADITRNVAALAGIPSCNLDVDDNGLIEPEFDGVAILRRMLGFGVAGFAGTSGAFAGNTTAASVFAATASSYNVTGVVGGPRAATDGLIITRAMKKLTGTAVTSGATAQSWATVQSWLNTNCGSTF
jgi:hypothetical protein